MGIIMITTIIIALKIVVYVLLIVMPGSKVGNILILLKACAFRSSQILACAFPRFSGCRPAFSPIAGIAYAFPRSSGCSPAFSPTATVRLFGKAAAWYGGMSD